METPSEKQRRVLAAKGDVLVLGGPGSGKTTVGLAAARARISAGLEPHQRVLFVSFSNSAVYQISNAAKLRLTKSERPLLVVQTFHAFCWELLRSNGYLLGFPRLLSPLPPERKAALCSGRGEAEWDDMALGIARSEGRICFDLFASLGRQILDACPPTLAIIRSCFPLVVVDEFQDTDDDQWAVLEAISRGQQVIALADPHQRIYDFRPGVRPERLDEFRLARQPTVVDFEDDNHRSPDSDIVRFAGRILLPKAQPYRSDHVNITPYRYANQLGVMTKYAVANARRHVERSRGPGPVSIVVLASTNPLVRKISEGLRRPTPKADWSVRHDAFVDSDELTNAWHVALAMLGNRMSTLDEHAAAVLRCMADFYLSQNSVDGRAKAQRIGNWIADLARGNWPSRTPLSAALRSVLESIRDTAWEGAPDADIQRTLGIVEKEKNPYLTDVVTWCRIKPPVRPDDAAYAALSAHFRSSGGYHGAGRIFERALMQERLVDRYRPPQGCSVMTMHRCKGREYDAVVIVDGNQPQHRLIMHDDTAPYDKSRRLLRVAITRARHCVRIITPQDDRCPLIP